jgi:hypothetical protein
VGWRGSSSDRSQVPPNRVTVNVSCLFVECRVTAAAAGAASLARLRRERAEVSYGLGGDFGPRLVGRGPYEHTFGRGDAKRTVSA